MQQYQIRPPRTLNSFNLSLYLLVIFAMLVFIHEIWMAGLLALLAILLMLSDCLRWQKLKLQGATVLTLYPDNSEIEVHRSYRPNRFKKFTLYLNRWFVILQLRDRDVAMNFLLIAERFGSMTEYLNFRRQILKMSRDQNVT